jgi:hypothetical protein
MTDTNILLASILITMNSGVFLIIDKINEVKKCFPPQDYEEEEEFENY